MLEGDTLSSALDKLNKLNSMLDDIKMQTEVPLEVAKEQSQKIMD